MQIVSQKPDAALSACVLALGNFDGVHRGHQAVLADVIATAQDIGVRPAVGVFEPHPRRHFQPDAPAFRLMNAQQQAHALSSLGIETLFQFPFDGDMAAMSPEDFVRTYVAGWANAAHVVVGKDFQFGKNRSGDLETLMTLGRSAGFGVTGLDLAGGDASKFSSSQIRKALADGELAVANDILTRPWSLQGVVKLGDQRGRTIGFPTANISLGDYLRPRLGVYAVTVNVEGEQYGGVANIGRRPTVQGEDERLEVHIFDFDDDLYGRELEVRLHALLRPEQKFSGLEELKAQIARDCVSAKAELAKLTN